MKIVFIIPARGGSKGVPRKNLRHLNGKPLISYAITMALQCKLQNAKVYVSTDDDEIAMVSERYGASIIKRDTDSYLAGDASTLDEVICNSFHEIEKIDKTEYELIITIQPTSPLIKSETVIAAISAFQKDPNTQTLLSVVDDTHLRWGYDKDDKPTPLYEKRLNRQELRKEYRETGGIVICTKDTLRSGTRFGDNVIPFEVDTSEATDIDTALDFARCESILNSTKILFIVSGYKEIGLGHAARCLTIANGYPTSEILFLFEEKSQLAYEYIRNFNYRCEIMPLDRIKSHITRFSPNLIINDTLDTTESYMKNVNSDTAFNVNFEDLGPGSVIADLVINDLYQPVGKASNVLSGPQYFCVRDEFTTLKTKMPPTAIDEVLLCFGGTDPADLTHRVLSILTQMKEFAKIHVTVILGIGYQKSIQLKQTFISHNNITIITNTNRISDYMHRADLAFTSNGRTALELASLNTLTISISQNKRETTHVYATEKNGIKNLGLHSDVDDKQITNSFTNFYYQESIRLKYHERLTKFNMIGGTQRVIDTISDRLKGRKNQ